MTVFSLNGDLVAHLTEMFETLEAGIAGGVGTGLTISGGFPYGVSLTGGGLFFPSSGPDFLTGTISGANLTLLELGTGGSGNTFTDLLQIDDIRIDASRLYSLVERTATSSYGQFEPGVFRAALNLGRLTITGSDNDDTAAPSTFVPFSDSTHIFGYGGNDTLTGGEGDDLLNGGDGDDLLRTGDGNNRAIGGDGEDDILGGLGADTMFGGSGRDLIVGFGGADIMGGGDGADSMNGGGGNDRIWGGTGWDTLTGGNGNDTIAGANGRDTVYGNSGNDLIFGAGYADRLSGGGGNDTLWGGDGSDQIFAGAGADLIDGGRHADLILGGTGNDTLNGGVGNDTLDGGADADVFIYTSGHDTIRDMEEADRIDLSRVQSVSVYDDLDSLLSQIGDHVVLTFDVGNTLTLLNVTLSDLDPDDFLF